MYSLGARKFVVNNIPPAGCFPSKAIHTRPIGKCDGKINKGITFYNKSLREVLHQLQSKLPGFTFIHADLYGFLKKMRQNGSYYGKKKPKCIHHQQKFVGEIFTNIFNMQKFKKKINFKKIKLTCE